MEEVVYFVQYHADGPIKIGTSQNPASRIKGLQSMCPYELVLLGTVDGGHEREAEFHKRFKDYCIRGEWFHPVPEIIEFIATNGANRGEREPINKIVRTVYIEPKVYAGTTIVDAKVEPKCKICQSERRTDIDVLLAAGVPHTEIVERMHARGLVINKHNVSRHARRHVFIGA